jgi:hypothetical protein
MMKFPRKADNSLDFKGFSSLSAAMQKEAFLDLKATGSVAERQEFQAWKTVAIQKKSELADMEARMKALDVREAELTAKLTEQVGELVNTLVLSSTPTTKPLSSQSQLPAKRTLKMS